MSNTYFLGGSSRSGFQTKFQDIMHEPGFFTYILKGGPGTGKSTLMKKIMAHFSDDEIELYYCSSDIKSLDAVVLKGKKAIIVDGTAPHVFNAEIPGVAQTLVDLGTCWDKVKLKQKETDIRRYFNENAVYHRRARRFITALSSVNQSIYEQAHDDLIMSEINEIAKNIAEYLPEQKGEGKCAYKPLAAITSEGYFTQLKEETLDVFGISDNRYAAGFLILRKLQTLLLQRGHDIVVSECMMFDKNQIEHIIVPEQDLQISLLTPLNRLDYPVKLNACDLYDKSEKQEYLRDIDTMRLLEKEAASSIKKALEIHDDLEQCYIGALNFNGLDKITADLIDSIESL